MGNRAKSLFCSVLLNEYHHRTKLMTLLLSDFVFKRKLRSQNLEISSPMGLVRLISSMVESKFEFEFRNLVTHRQSPSAMDSEIRSDSEKYNITG
jgi:hypothetical protein